MADNYEQLAAKVASNERRLDAIEKVLVAVARAVHGWGLSRDRYRLPGEVWSPNNNGKETSPFEPIAHLHTPPEKTK